MTDASRLQRQLGIPGAVILGLGSMVGAGVFISLALGAQVSGAWVLLAIVLAGGLATCNGLSSAQLAACHPVSGGTYEYGYRFLNAPLGMTAGWMFLCAKSASAATAALVFGGYLLKLLGQPATPALTVTIALAVVVLLTLLVLSGVRRSNHANAVIVSITFVALLALVSVSFVRRPAELAWSSAFSADTFSLPALLQATALVFVAFTGYGRVATMGEEVRDPGHTIPRAVAITIAVTALLYLLVAAGALQALGVDGFGSTVDATGAPLVVAGEAAGGRPLAILVAIGATVATIGVLLNLILGLSRVMLAMGRRGDMPAAVARLDAARTTPWVAVLVVGGIVAGLTLIGDLRTTWSFSAFTVLVYYALANLAALQVGREHRRYPQWVPLLGLGGCLGLAFWVEVRIWVAGLILIAIGLLWQQAARRLSR